ncbi:hypothetical protein CYY_006888 [Polysphondylium violaceum]|uniref:Ribosome biogenesis protein NOP53 n=1 Tax=Polysphondylium violaceum TaxID=133409 RepID=A0A8J4V5D2_9MYCE|nr:hypothetical protein CYY_006888 [Polysphondylium violaceum]
MVHKKNQKQRGRKEVSEVLAEVREKEIQDNIKFGAPVEEKKDEQLFVVSKKGDDKIQSNGGVDTTRLSRIERILAPNPNIEPMAVSPKFEPKENVVTPLNKKLANKAKQIEKERQIRQNNKIGKHEKKKLKGTHADLWDDQHINAAAAAPSVTASHKTVAKAVAMAGQKHKKTEKVNSVIQKDHDFISQNLLTKVTGVRVNHTGVVAPVPAVELPAPGMSFNPDFEDHQDALGMAIAKELKAQDYLDDMDSVLNPEQIDYGRSTVDDEEPQPDTPVEPYVPPQNERITKKEKKKRQRIAEQKKKEKLALERKAFNEQIDRSLEILEEVKEKESRAAKLKKIRDDLKQSKTKAHRLGKYNLSIDPEPVILTEDLPKYLNQVSNTNHHPLKERYQSLQKRHIIEAQGPQMKLKVPKKKVYTSNKWNNTRIASINE